MADNFEQKQRAANLRLLQAMSGGGMQRPQPGVPNYSAIPLNATVEPSPMAPQGQPQWTGEGDSRPPLPPVMADADYAQPTMAPPPMQARPPMAGATPPMGANAAYVPPPTDNYADMGGYGGMPRMQSPQQQYGHLNPTPGLEEIFRREYAANPGAFGKLFG